MGVQAGLGFRKEKCVKCTKVFSGSNILSQRGAYSEPDVICSYPWLVSSPVVIIVCLFKFPCATLIGFLNFICPLVSITYSTLTVSDCVCGFCVSTVCGALVKYTFSIVKNSFRHISHSCFYFLKNGIVLVSLIVILE